jgi:DMSO/TMAO reductase YedYZ molybdopterin-dependent catalytic subunit
MQRPLGYPSGMILHTTAGLALLGLCFWHLALRRKPLRAVDLRHRRSLLALAGLGIAGGAARWGVDALNRAAALPGAARRFTGSRLADGGVDGPFPVTNWMFDPIPTVGAAQYQLQVGGAVAVPQRYGLADLAARPQTVVQAVLDCTGGWYTEQSWRGVRVGDLLAEAGVSAGASGVRFRSSTGYRWSLPLDEAQAALLALEVGGAPLTAGHGAPLRLVAPGRRGFQWVKWVVAVEVLTGPDAGQWGAIFTSGLDGA